jgi:hypothetical protein
MFIVLIFSYLIVGIGGLFSTLAILGSFGRAITGADEPFNETFGLHVGIAIAAVLLYFAFSSVLLSLEYVSLLSYPPRIF